MLHTLFKDVFDNQLYIECACGGEIIEIVADNSDYFIHTHLQYDCKLDPDPDFFFPDYAHFKVFIQSFIDLLNYPNDADMTYREVKCMDSDNIGMLTCYRQGLGAGIIGICKYRNEQKYKKNKPTWELVVDDNLVPRLVQELKNFMGECERDEESTVCR